MSIKKICLPKTSTNQMPLIMHRNFLIIFLTFLFHLNTSAQSMIINHDIANNDTIVRELITSTSSKSVVFFCPTAKVSKDFYHKKALELEKKLKQREISDLSLHIIYYVQDTKNNSKGLKLYSLEMTDSIIISDFQCFFINFNQNFLNRSMTKFPKNFDLDKPFDNENLFSVPIVDTNKCFDKIQDRIPFYTDFIAESILPNYSNDEKMQFLRDSINTLYNVIEDLRFQFEQFKVEFSKDQPNNQDKTKLLDSPAIQNNSENRKKKN